MGTGMDRGAVYGKGGGGGGGGGEERTKTPISGREGLSHYSEKFFFGFLPVITFFPFTLWK